MHASPNNGRLLVNPCMWFKITLFFTCYDQTMITCMCDEIVSSKTLPVFDTIVVSDEISILSLVFHDFHSAWRLTCNHYHDYYTIEGVYYRGLVAPQTVLFLCPLPLIARIFFVKTVTVIFLIQ